MYYPRRIWGTRLKPLMRTTTKMQACRPPPRGSAVLPPVDCPESAPHAVRNVPVVAGNLVRRRVVLSRKTTKRTLMTDTHRGGDNHPLLVGVGLRLVLVDHLPVGEAPEDAWCRMPNRVRELQPLSRKG